MLSSFEEDCYTPSHMETTSSSSFWTPLAAVALGGLFYLAGVSLSAGTPLAAGNDRPVPQITVSGDGKVSAAPNIGLLTFGVQTGRMTSAKTAMDKLAKDMNAVIAAVKGAGVEEKDITTQQLSLSPAYDWNNGQQISRGFEASQMLSVKVRNLDTIGDVLSAATNAGANSAGGVQFTIDDPDALQAEARQKAIAEAKEKATVLAKQLGVTLKRISGFNENSGGYPTPMMYGIGGMKDVAVRSEALEIPAGEQDIHSNVTITYEIE